NLVARDLAAQPLEAREAADVIHQSAARHVDGTVVTDFSRLRYDVAQRRDDVVTVPGERRQHTGRLPEAVLIHCVELGARLRLGRNQRGRIGALGVGTGEVQEVNTVRTVVAE